jgi:multiple sugar transport system ATP-binding protein
MAKIILKSLKKRFDQIEAVRDISLEIADKEFVVLVGPSGCGKTTVLRLIAGLETPTRGEILIDDTIVNDMTPKDRDVAMVFQNYALFPHLNVYENIAFGLKLRKLPRQDTDRRVRDSAKMLNIADLLNRKPAQLSGGQRQRVAVGRAIARKPKVYLFDEPLSNLDAKMRVQMRAEFVKLHERTETTFVYVTHDQIEAMTLADRIVVMKDGDVQQVGEPFELFEKPANMFVADFIGSPSMNFLKCKVVQENAGLFLKEGPLNFKFAPDFEKILLSYRNKEIILGIRPEHMYTSAPSGQETSEPDLRAIVDVAEPTGSTVYLFLKAGPFEPVCTVNAKNRPQSHAEVKVWFDRHEIHLFDPVSEKTIYSAD